MRKNFRTLVGMPPSSAVKAALPISHNSTLTFALVGGLLTAVVLCVATFVTTQADVRYQGKDLEALKASKPKDDAEREEMRTQLRIFSDRLTLQKEQLDRIEGKMDTYFAQPPSSPSTRRASVTQP